MKRLESAGVVVYTKKGKKILYLLLHNSKGHWDFAKGEIEKGENKKEAALRELKEEAGITATLQNGFEHSYSYFFTDQDGQKVHKTVYFFVGQTDITDVQLSYEHDDFGWFSFDEAIKNMKFKEGRELLKKVDGFVGG